jgi:hypothetical protein
MMSKPQAPHKGRPSRIDPGVAFYGLGPDGIPHCKALRQNRGKRERTRVSLKKANTKSFSSLATARFTPDCVRPSTSPARAPPCFDDRHERTGTGENTRIDSQLIRAARLNVFGALRRASDR